MMDGFVKGPSNCKVCGKKQVLVQVGGYRFYVCPNKDHRAPGYEQYFTNNICKYDF